MYQNGGKPRVYKTITKDQAQVAFDNYYASDPKVTRGPRKDTSRFTARGAVSARTQDFNYTKAPTHVVTDSRYLRNPHGYDFQGVDTGPKVRKTGKPASVKQLAARAKFTAMAKARSRASKQAKAEDDVRQSAGNPLEAFDRYYAGPNIPKGPVSGKPLFKSERGMKSAHTYDKNHTRNLTDNASLYASNPRKYDFAGVDDGPMVRAPATAAQLAWRTKFADLRRKVKTQTGAGGGYWW
jgi:hypothetical protein